MPYLLQVVSRGTDGAGEERWQPSSLYITVDRKREILGTGPDRQTEGRTEKYYKIDPEAMLNEKRARFDREQNL